MTSEIDDPSVETDLCDNLERVAYRVTPTRHVGEVGRAISRTQRRQ